MINSIHFADVWDACTRGMIISAWEDDGLDALHCEISFLAAALKWQNSTRIRRRQGLWVAENSPQTWKLYDTLHNDN